jgi:hypothetical protein
MLRRKSQVAHKMLGYHAGIHFLSNGPIEAFKIPGFSMVHLLISLLIKDYRNMHAGHSSFASYTKA